MSSPVQLPSPGEALKEHLRLKGWTQKDLAAILGVYPPTISNLVNGKCAISLEIAHDLAAAFGNEATYWLNLEQAFRLPTSAQPAQDIVRRARIFDSAPIADMVKRRWIQDTSDVELLEKQILGFYGVSSLDEIVTPPHAAKKSGSYSETTAAERAWMQKARTMGRMVAARQFSDDSLDDVVSEFKKLMLHPESARHIPKLLADAGIRFVIVEPLPRARFDGVCLWLDKSSPIVALSLRINQIDCLWFNLFHELGHAKRRDGLLSPPVIDCDLTGENSIPSDKKPKAEREADSYASQNLIGAPDIENFIARVKPLYSKTKIQGFAARMGVHAGIVVGQLQHRGEIDWTHSRDLQVKVREILTQSALTDGWGQSLPIAS